jgi:hypothetical protein
LAKSIDQYIIRLTKFEEFLNQGHVTSIKDINAITREFGDDFENWDSEMVRKELEIEVLYVIPFSSLRKR